MEAARPWLRQDVEFPPTRTATGFRFGGSVRVNPHPISFVIPIGARFCMRGSLGCSAAMWRRHVRLAARC